MKVLISKDKEIKEEHTNYLNQLIKKNNFTTGFKKANISKDFKVKYKTCSHHHENHGNGNAEIVKKNTLHRFIEESLNLGL